jgi:aspartate racemase
MKTLGVVGGIGPDSTVDYYLSLMKMWREKTADGTSPSILINSIDLTKLLGLIAAQALPELAAYLSAEVERLARAGAGAGLIAANTPHIVFDEVQRLSSIPLISIVEAVREAAEELGFRKLGLLGNKFTMQGLFYSKVFSRAGISLVVPNHNEQDQIHPIYMNELVKGIFLPESRERLLAIADRLAADERVQGVILAGTELPLLLRDANCGISFLDTAQIHVKAAMSWLLS